jgi:hypothetical protein
VLWTGWKWKAILIGSALGSSPASSTSVSRELEADMGILEKLMKWMAEHYAKERGGMGWKWQAMDSKNSPAALGGEKTGNNPTDRRKLGAKINLLVEQSGAPLSVVLTGANRHEKISAVDLIVSMVLKRPAHKKSSTCARIKPTMPQMLGNSPLQEATPPTSRSIPQRKTQPNRAANRRSERTLMGSLIRRGDG